MIIILTIWLTVVLAVAGLLIGALIMDGFEFWFERRKRRDV